MQDEGCVISHVGLGGARLGSGILVAVLHGAACDVLAVRVKDEDEDEAGKEQA